MLLEDLAANLGVFISDLRLQVSLRESAIRELRRTSEKNKYSIAEWNSAISYLLGFTVCMNDHETIEAFLLCCMEKEVQSGARGCGKQNADVDG